jgi:alkylation response protein AidB-like acyl-CoA dehydrogenase
MTQHTDVPTTTPADVPTTEDVVAALRDAAPLLRSNAATGEADRRVPEESIAALEEAGFFKVPVPRRHGGYELPVRAMLEASAAVAEADGGAAWAGTLINVNSWTLSLFPASVVDEVYAEAPQAKFAGILQPGGVATRVPGGYRLTGRWFYASGVWHSTHASLGCVVHDEAGEIIDQGMAIVRREDFEVIDIWHVAGMRASGSNSIVVEDVFVPEDRVVGALRQITGEYIQDHPDAPLYRAALFPLLALVLVGPQLGLGRAALQLVVDKAGSKDIPYTTYTRQSDSVGFQLQIAEAAIAIDTAHLHAYRAADDLQRYAEEGVYPDVVARARVRADTAVALRNINTAINTLLFAHGAAGFAESSALQRIWRDSNVGARHAYMLPDVNLEIYGKALLGVDEQITPLI